MASDLEAKPSDRRAASTTLLGGGLSGSKPVAMILAEQVLEIFEQSGTTPREQDTALDILRTLVHDRIVASNAFGQRRWRQSLGLPT